MPKNGEKMFKKHLRILKRFCRIGYLKKKNKKKPNLNKKALKTNGRL